MPVLFNNNTGSNSWQAFAVPQGSPRPEVADVAAARNYRPIGREFQGHHPSQGEGPGLLQIMHYALLNTRVSEELMEIQISLANLI